MKILNILPYYYKILGFGLLIIGFFFFGSNIFGYSVLKLRAEGFSVALILLSSIMIIISKEKNQKLIAIKQKALVYAIILNSVFLAVAALITSFSGGIYDLLFPFYVNAISVFVIYFIIYFTIQFNLKTGNE